MGRTDYGESRIRKPARRMAGEKEGRLLLGVKSVPESLSARREPRALECEASVLTTELTAPIHSYFTPKSQLCKIRKEEVG